MSVRDSDGTACMLKVPGQACCRGFVCLKQQHDSDYNGGGEHTEVYTEGPRQVSDDVIVVKTCSKPVTD